MRSILLITLTLVAPLAHAARLEVVLPTAGDIEVIDQSPPDTGPRIACPPTCTYERPGPGTGISALNVRVKPDPVTDDPAWDVISLDGCSGTSTLPADSGICYLSGSGDQRVVVNLRYRPIVAVKGAGTIGAPLGFLFVNVGPGPGYQGSGSGYACDLTPPIGGRCASHYSFGQPISVSTGTSSKATLVDWSGPCAGAGDSCVFNVLQDTCITAEFTNTEPPEFPKQTLDGPECPTGGGNPGTSTTTPTTTTTTTTTTTLPDYLDQLVDDIVESIPFSAPLGLRGTAPSGGVIRVRVTTSSPGTTRGLATAQATREVVVAKGSKKLRRAGEFTLKIKPTKQGRRLVKQRVVFLAVVQAELRTKAGVEARRRFVPVTP